MDEDIFDLHQALYCIHVSLSSRTFPKIFDKLHTFNGKFTNLEMDNNSLSSTSYKITFSDVMR